MMRIEIDRKSDISIYKQIVSQVVEAVENDFLKPGDRLPSEREFSEDMNIARGTVQRAYKELERKSIIETIKGSGSFISKSQDILQRDRKDTAIYLIDELIMLLEKSGFTSREIRTFIDIRMTEREKKQDKVHIAVIDCNPEALESFKVQIAYMKNIDYKMFVIDEIISCLTPYDILQGYDIIITTPTHYDQISRIIYPLNQRLFKVAVSPSRETIIRLATISKNSKVGIVVRSMNFKKIIFKHLDSLNIERNKMEYTFVSNISDLKRFLKEKDILIIPQCYSFQNTEMGDSVKTYVENGGKVIEFKYQIERGSLIYIEEQIGDVLRRR